MQIGVESSRSVENKRIFVVDSNEINRAVLQFMLQDENETHEMASLEAALEKARDWRPDLILIGLELLQEGGDGTLREIVTALPGTRILVVTETASDPRAQACLKSGAHGLLAKPFRVESVRERVNLTLGRGITDFIPMSILASSTRPGK
jgi:CheY-like chemotaxis protein